MSLADYAWSAYADQLRLLRRQMSGDSERLLVALNLCWPWHELTPDSPALDHMLNRLGILAGVIAGRLRAWSEQLGKEPYSRSSLEMVHSRLANDIISALERENVWSFLVAHLPELEEFVRGHWRRSGYGDGGETEPGRGLRPLPVVIYSPR
ncbi:MAG: hypothetical protein AB1445_15495 [Bacillota bacterium]